MELVVDSRIQCNRLQPCQHCTGRAKPELCRYESNGNKDSHRSTTGEDGAGSAESRIEPSTTSHTSSLPETYPLSSQDHTNLVSMLGYSLQSPHNPLGLMKQVGPTPPCTLNRLSTCTGKQTILDQKYRSLIRQLPSKDHVDILVKQFFSEINWHYDVIDEITFRQQLETWRRIPHSAHSHATSVLPADVMAFPSLLFQLMSHALLHRPVTEGLYPSLESLKYASGMTFFDLACDFSEAGSSTLETMGKQEVTVVAVQSGILRASLLKNIGNVIEAWHVLGTAIRDAQEIGLHAESSHESSASIDAQWDWQMRRRIWFVLHNWDIHMAVVLGRPITTTMAAGSALSLPDDLAHRESGAPPRKRTSRDPPTPSSLIRVGYDVAYRYFPRVRNLEDRGARIEDYNIVGEMHAAILESMDRAPSWCRHGDPDRLFDEFPGCHWLPAATLALTSGVYFVLLSLHRPYIFSVAESRTEALTAALKILTMQKRLFHLSAPQQYISFNMVYPMFDAMVISLATIVLFPNENLDLLSELIHHLRWGIDMLSKIGEHNAMAQAACSVAKNLFSHMVRSGGHALQQVSLTSESMSERSNTGSGSVDSAKAGLEHDFLDANFNTELSSPTCPPMEFRTTNSLDLDLETLLPPHPVHDLFYQDILAPDIQDTVPDFLIENPDVDGAYLDNSFWKFMDNLN